MHIDLEQKRLDIPFLIALLATLFLPSFRLFFFAPFLIMAIYQKPIKRCLWLAFLVGAVIDLLASYQHFGLTALNFCICTLLLYPQKKHFFSDRLTTLPLMTFLFSALSTIVHFFFQQVPFSLLSLITEVGIMPLLDALTAMVLYTLPPLLLGYRPKRGADYFL